MFFTIKDLDRYQTFMLARSFIIRYKTGPNEVALNKYFLENYKTNLKQMCLNIVANMTFSEVDGETLVIINDKKLDKIASLITYGNSELPHSNILKYAFYRD